MKRDEFGRWVPTETREHLFYWPIVIVGMAAVYYGAYWIADQLRPSIHTFSVWFASWV